MNQAQRWALAPGALLQDLNKLNPEHLGGVDGWFQPVSNMIARDWGINDVSSAHSTLRWLLMEGHRDEVEELCQQWDSFVEDTGTHDIEVFAEGDAKRRFVATHRAKLTGKSLVAWDAGRLVCLAGWSFRAGHSTEEEAWQYIMAAAAVVQKAYSSWAEFGEHYILGFEYWADSSGDKYKGIVERLTTTGMWSQLPWQTSLKDSGVIVEDEFEFDPPAPQGQGALGELVSQSTGKGLIFAVVIFLVIAGFVGFSLVKAGVFG